MDVMQLAGWYEQPAEKPIGRWNFHIVDFTNGRPNLGGADMFAYDVDGDGDNDVVTSLAAHEFGLAWYEQVGNRDGEPEFKMRLIIGKTPDENRYGVVFSELHGVNLVDMDGDGLKDIVTGKTYWSHHRKAHSGMLARSAMSSSSCAAPTVSIGCHFWPTPIAASAGR